MDSQNRVPFRISHILEQNIIRHNTGIVDEDIDTTKSMNSRFNYSLAVLNAVVVGNSFTITRYDFLDNGICGLQDANCQQLESSTGIREG